MSAARAVASVRRLLDRGGRPLVVSAIGALALVGLAADIRLLAWYWPGSFYDTVTSSDWTALAWDFAHGEFYRPLVGHGGYGGTRFMPLFFVLHGLLLRTGFDPIVSGVALTQLTVVAAAAGAFAALRAARVPAAYALPLAGTVWATIVYQKVSPDIRADYLAAAIAAGALAAAQLGSRPGRSRWLVAAAAGCVLAGLTKVTSIAFTAAIAVWMWRDKRRRSAVRFAIGTTALYIAAVAALQVASQGHLFENFRNSADGGTGLHDLLTAPLTFARWIAIEPFVAAPFMVACWRLGARRGARPSLFNAHFVTVALVTLVIYGSPGTNSTQTIDVQVAGMLVVGETLASGELPELVGAAGYGVLAVVLALVSWPVSWIPSVYGMIAAHGPRPRAVIAPLRREFLPPGRPYLTTDPIIPVLAGERPVMLDDFGLRLQYVKRTPGGLDLERRIRAREFAAVILREDGQFPRSMAAGDAGFDVAYRRWLAANVDALTTLVRSAYEVRAVRKPFVIFTPAR